MQVKAKVRILERAKALMAKVKAKVRILERAKALTKVVANLSRKAMQLDRRNKSWTQTFVRTAASMVIGKGIVTKRRPINRPNKVKCVWLVKPWTTSKTLPIPQPVSVQAQVLRQCAWFQCVHQTIMLDTLRT